MRSSFERASDISFRY